MIWSEHGGNKQAACNPATWFKTLAHGLSVWQMPRTDRG
jgi:hypothetical protein